MNTNKKHGKQLLPVLFYAFIKVVFEFSEGIT